VDQPPALDGTPVACLHIGIFGFRMNPGSVESAARFSPESGRLSHGSQCVEDLDKIDERALEVFKATSETH
jgi:hypothetical protein